MMIVKAVCTPNAGRAEEARAAVRELTERARTHRGVLAYFWSEDPHTGELIDYEVHEDEAALVRHIAESDLTRIHACMAISAVEVYGDHPSPALHESLSSFGSYKHFPGV